MISTPMIHSKEDEIFNYHTVDGSEIRLTTWDGAKTAKTLQITG